jgi:hypothetical protein
MKIVTIAAVTGAGVFLAGCLPIATAENVGTMPMADLCTSVIVARNLENAEGAALALAEIDRRGQFSAAEMQQIRVNNVVPGMSEAAAVCAWGNAYDAVNVTATAGGTSKQFVYASDFSKTRYFYTENGRVTAVQM